MGGADAREMVEWCRGRVSVRAYAKGNYVCVVTRVKRADIGSRAGHAPRGRGEGAPEA